MSKQNYATLEEYYNNIVRQAVEDCTLCGECVRNCPVFPFTSIEDNEIMQRVVNFLEKGTFDKDVYLKAFGCAGGGECAKYCPQGIDPLLVHEAVKIRMIKHGENPPESMNFLLPGQKFNLYEILSAIQTKPSEMRWLKRVPAQPEKTENVVFLGCSPSALPHNIYAFIDILENMGVDFITLSGGELCCGTTYCPAAGNVGQSENKARDLVANIKTFSPKRVILVCTGCYRQFTEFFPEFLDLDFDVKFYTQFLSENVDSIKFTKPLTQSVTLFESCMTRRTKVNESVKKLLKAIPGLNVMELDYSEFLCCGGIANMTYPEIGQMLGNKLIEEVRKTGADFMVNTCSFCQLSSYPKIRELSFGLKDITTLVNESIGGREYEDKLEKYWKYGNVDMIIEESKENFEANGYTEEEMKNILPLIFQ